MLVSELLDAQGKPRLEEMQAQQAWRCWRNHHTLFGPASLLEW